MMMNRFVIFFAYLLYAVSAEKTISTSFQKDPQKSEEPKLLARQWLIELFEEAKKQFRMDIGVSASCRNDFERYKKNLQNQTVWAVRMAESSEWPSMGLFAGIVDRMGNYDECLLISSRELKGQYCMVKAVYQFPNNQNSAYGSSIVYLPNEEASVWDTLQMYQRNPIHLNRQKLNWAMCVPSSCSPTDLVTALNYTLTPLFRTSQLNVTVQVNPARCSIKQTPDLPLGFYLLSVLIASTVALCVICTMNDWRRNYGNNTEDKKKSDSRPLYEEFSLIHNFKKLTDTSNKEELPFGHFFKILYMCIIIFGHRGLYRTQIAMFNPELAEKNRHPWSIRLVNLSIVDAFFYFSGLLTFYYGFKPVKKLGWLYVILSVITRWVRLVPALLILQLFVIFILPYLHDGPLWNERISVETEHCKVSFWANFFSVSNFIHADKQCLIISWYVAVDIQLAIIGAILLLLISRREKLGLVATAATLLASVIVTFVVVYINRYNGQLLIYYNTMRELWTVKEFNYFYVTFYPRIPPYLIGFLTAYILTRLEKKNFEYSMVTKYLLAIVGFFIKCLDMVYGLQFYQLGRPYDPLENGIFAAVSRAVYVLFEAIVTVVGYNKGDTISGIFSAKIYIPFGRLTYSVFLVNSVVQLFHTTIQRTVLESTSTVNEVWLVTSDIVYSYLLGFLLYMFVEAPLTSLSKRFLRKLLGSIVKSKEELKVRNPAFTYFAQEEALNGKQNTVTMSTLSENGIDNKNFRSNEEGVS